jgi:hypothetical protein
MPTRFVCLGILALVLNACAEVPHEYLPLAAKDKIAATDVVVPIRQSEIYVFVPTSTAGASAGLIGVLVDAAVDSIRTEKAEAAVKPLRNVLVDFNIDATLQPDLKTSLSQDGWLHVGDVRVLKDVSRDSLQSAFSKSSAQAVLFVSADYQLSNDADVFTFKLAVGLYPRDPALAALKQGASTTLDNKNSLYRNTLSFEARPPGETSDRDRNIAILSAENGAWMRKMLTMGAAKLSSMLAADLQAAEGEANLASFNNDPDGTIVRAPNGTLKFTARPQ